jgi:hypothetical protein
MFRVTFLTDDKHVTTILHALANKVHELEIVPVINAKKKANGSVQGIAGDMHELFMKEVRKQGLKEVNAKASREIMDYLGGNPGSYYHVLRRCMNEGLLKKVPSKKGNVHVTYTVQPVK